MRCASGTGLWQQGLYVQRWQKLAVPVRRHTCRLPRTPPRALFTGIVQGVAHVTDVRTSPDFRQLCIQFPAESTSGLQIGASIAINGTCLTVTGADAGKGMVNFDVIQETLRATNLGELSAGSAVNFERSAKMGDEVGGHNVAGHIHTTAIVASAEQTSHNLKITFQVPQQWMKYVFAKGFIAVDGISLTVGEVDDTGFCVYLIPETLRATTLGTRRPGQSVNIEIESQTQTVVDTVEKVLASYLERQGLLPRTPEAAKQSVL